MRSYYTGWRARHYNARWRTYTRRTLAEVLAMIDFAALRNVPERLGRLPRLLDVACGTGILLKELLERVPNAEAYGVDASADMLDQARIALKDQLRVQLEQVEVGAGETAKLPYARGSFNLITFTNALHDMPDPVGTLVGLRGLLTQEGQLVVVDFARREPPFPWTIIEWLVRHIEGTYMHAYTLAEAQSLCQQAGLHVACGRAFTVDWLWHGWCCAHRARKALTMKKWRDILE
jgi:ubiquinone/menaquinone biosynthesis C-methylase UbiE